MPFQKGNKYGKETSRKGIPNKNTKIVKEGFEQLVANNVDKLQADLDKLSPRDRINAMRDLAKYVIPSLKQSEVEMNANVNNSGLDEDTLDKIVNGLDL